MRMRLVLICCAITALLASSIRSSHADVVVFQSGRTVEGKITGETATSIEFEIPMQGHFTYQKDTLKEIRRDNPLPGEVPADQSIAAVSAQTEAARNSKRYQDAFNAIFAVVQQNPESVSQLSSEYSKTLYAALPQARERAKSDLELARNDYLVIANALAHNKARELTGADDVFNKSWAAVRTELGAIDVKLGQDYRRKPGMEKQAQALLKEAVELLPNDDQIRLQLADIALTNKDFATALTNYERVSVSMTAPAQVKSLALDGLRRVKDESGGQFQSTAVATPLPVRTPRTVITPTPSIVAAPTPAPTPPPAAPPTGPKWKQLIWKVQHSDAYGSAKSLGSEVMNGEHNAIVIGIPVILLLGWVIPYYFIQYRAKRGDVVAGQYRRSAKHFGLIAVILWGAKSIRFGGTGTPKNRCPFCNKGIDNIDQYSDLNFYTCPHCRENITPIYDLKDYIDNLVTQLEQNAKRGRPAESNLEKDAMVKLVRAVITMALRRRASDLHVDSEVEGAKVRARIDGVMYDLMNLPRAVSNAFISAMKVMANLDITERRMPQDGTLSLWIDKTDIDLRINTSPTPMGEKVSIRIQNQKQIQVEPAKLGLDGQNLERFERSIHRPHGLIIVTGPSGSGKSTTLYVALNQLNTGERNIVTIEDPIEYQVKGLSQMQVNPAANFTFATGLRSILRQDPDVIMVGEIRDQETAEIAVESALTGHLVFTTLHTIDAPSAFNRLADLGVETRRLANAIICIIGMRLIRTICPDCKKPYKPKRTDLEQLGLADDKNLTFVHGSGCENCLQTGYFGRMGLFEFLIPDEALREILETSPQVSTIREVARKGGYRTLREDGIQRIIQGLTTVEEVIRVTS